LSGQDLVGQAGQPATRVLRSELAGAQRGGDGWQRVRVLDAPVGLTAGDPQHVLPEFGQTGVSAFTGDVSGLQ
jgi:hypothetical protein